MTVTILEEVLRDVRAELASAKRKFPTWPDDIIHASAIVAEEAGELVKECNEWVYEPGKTNLEAVEKEARQVAASALRFLISSRTCHGEPSTQHSQE